MSRASLLYALPFAGTFACQVYDESLLRPDDAGSAVGMPETGTRLDARADAREGESSCGPAGSAGCTGDAGSGGGDAAGAGGATGGTGGATGGTAGTGGATGGSGGGTSGAGGAGDAQGGVAGADGASGGAAGADGASGGAAGGPDATDGTGGGAGAVGCNVDAGDAACRDAAPDADGGAVDKCPTDPQKTEPGVCGCGVPDTDTDRDGGADGLDTGPPDPQKTQIGLCGCNAADPTNPDAGEAFCLKALLVHRYSFNGTGTVATDSIGTANGAINGGANATLSGGVLTLTGDVGPGYTNEGYVSLPSGILGGLSSATFETWVTWRGTGDQGSQLWQRIFDFGDQVASGADLVGNTYLFLTPYATSSGLLRVAYSTSGNANETMVNGAGSFPIGAEQHVAVVIDDANDTMTLYLSGNQAGTVQWAGHLADINNASSWLGRSAFSVDSEFNGVFNEFRIYNAALTANQIRVSYAAGPNPPSF